MEISQLYKSTYNNLLQQSISLWLPRYAWTKYDTSNQGRVRNNPSVRNQQKCYWVEKIKILPVCLSRSCKTIIHAQFAQKDIR